MIKKQLKPPLVALMSGTPITDGLVDLVFPLAVINSLWQEAPPISKFNGRTPQVRDDIGDLRRKLKELQGKLPGTLSALDRHEIATKLTSYFFKSPNATSEG
ncbi:hypothetical protein CSOJ01_14251 [Colletotrichum sojae]|uniref:Uncharacterized protein n=1 Tax=Colletotrichum sojae TaxID=2175907 RepID=A0A8H6MJA0_9PEZI|nr:hypothetical protein CSOJ01_14251 [Colletotrichum sojae]